MVTGSRPRPPYHPTPPAPPQVRATHGAHEGTWYYEVHIEELGASGAARVGWATRHAELQAPVGHDAYGYSYRSKEGSKVRCACRAGGRRRGCVTRVAGACQRYPCPCARATQPVHTRPPTCPSALVHSPFTHTHTWQVSEAWRDGYGEAYGEGDVIGCLIHLPPGGGVWEKTLEGEKLGLRIVSYVWVVVAVECV